MKKNFCIFVFCFLLNSCAIITLVDGVLSSLFGLFVYNEQTQEIYQFVANSKNQIKLDVEKIYVDEKGRKMILLKNIAEKYHPLLVVVE